MRRGYLTWSPRGRVSSERAARVVAAPSVCISSSAGAAQLLRCKTAFRLRCKTANAPSFFFTMIKSHISHVCIRHVRYSMHDGIAIGILFLTSVLHMFQDSRVKCHVISLLGLNVKEL